MNNSNPANNRVESWKLKSAGARTYFLDLKRTRQGNTYLQFTESRPAPDGQDGFEQSRFFVFSEDYENFFKMLGDAYRHLQANPELLKPPGQRSRQQETSQARAG